MVVAREESHPAAHGGGAPVDELQTETRALFVQGAAASADHATAVEFIHQVQRYADAVIAHAQRDARFVSFG